MVSVGSFFACGLLEKSPPLCGIPRAAVSNDVESPRSARKDRRTGYMFFLESKPAEIKNCHPRTEKPGEALSCLARACGGAGTTTTAGSSEDPASGWWKANQNFLQPAWLQNRCFGA